MACAEQAPVRNLLLLPQVATQQVGDGTQVPQPVSCNRHASIIADGTGAKLLLTSGKIAEMAFRGEKTSWAGFNTLRMVVAVPEPGLLALNLMERDTEGRENYSVLRELPAGRQELLFDLRAQPEGDLTPQLPRQDDVWNPDAALGVDLAFVAFPHGMEVLALELTNIER